MRPCYLRLVNTARLLKLRDITFDHSSELLSALAHGRWSPCAAPLQIPVVFTDSLAAVTTGGLPKLLCCSCLSLPMGQSCCPCPVQQLRVPSHSCLWAHVTAVPPPASSWFQTSWKSFPSWQLSSSLAGNHCHCRCCNDRSQLELKIQRLLLLLKWMPTPLLGNLTIFLQTFNRAACLQVAGIG